MVRKVFRALAQSYICRLVPRGLERGDYRNFHKKPWAHQLSLDASTSWRVAGRNPSIPYGIELLEQRWVGEPDGSAYNILSTDVLLLKQAINLVEDFFGLARDRSFRGARNLA